MGSGSRKLRPSLQVLEVGWDSDRPSRLCQLTYCSLSEPEKWSQVLQKLKHCPLVFPRARVALPVAQSILSAALGHAPEASRAGQLWHLHPCPSPVPTSLQKISPEMGWQPPPELQKEDKKGAEEMMP